MDGQSDHLITGLFCPTCGYDMTGHERAERVTCPECGAAHQIDQLSVGPPPSRLTRKFRSAARVSKYVLIVAAIAGTGLVVLNALAPRLFHRGPHRPLQPALKMRLVHQSALVFGREYGGMPDHVALLIADNYVNSDAFLDPALSTSSLSVGDVNMMWFGWSEDTAARLRDAVAEMDLANSIYAFGDYYFVGWETTLLDSRLIFSWSKPDSSGSRIVCFMDNSVHPVSQNEWQAMWDQDAAARKELGLPTLKKQK